MNKKKLSVKLLILCMSLLCLNANAQEVRYKSEDGNLVLYKLEGSEPCMARKNLEVFQADGTSALVCEVGNASCKYSGKQLMLLWDDHHYYDGEIIPNPAGKCAKQIGVYRYETVSKNPDGSQRYRTVPVISIVNK